MHAAEADAGVSSSGQGAAGDVRQVAASPSAPAVDVADQVRRGKELYTQSRFDEARTVFRAILDQAPDEPQANYWLGQIFMRDKKFDEGLRYLVRSVELAPQNARLRIALAQAYVAATRHDDAERVLRAVLEQEPGNIEAQLNLGRLFVEGQRLADAIMLYEKMTRQTLKADQAKEAQENLRALYDSLAGEMTKKTKSVTVWLQDEDLVKMVLERGKKLVQAGDGKAALALLTPLAGLRPDDPQPQYWLGRALMMQKDYEHGIAHIEQSTSLAADNLRLVLSLGQAYEEAGRLEDAESTYHRVIDSSQDTRLADQARRAVGVVRAQRFFKQQDTAAAIAEYEALLAAFPDDIDIMKRASGMYEAGKRPEDAERMLARARELKPDDPDIYLALANIYEGRGDKEHAAEQLKLLISQTPNEGPAFERVLDRLGVNQALKDLREGRAGQAVQSLKRLDGLIPGNVRIKLYFATALLATKNYPQAELVLKEILALKPEDIDANLHYGRMLVELGRSSEALPYLKNVQGDDSRRVNEAKTQLVRAENDLLKQGNTLLEQGNLAGAEEKFNLILQYSPDDARAHYYLSQVAIKRKKYDVALQDIERGVALAPKSVALRRALGQTYEQAGLLDKAAAAFLAVIDLDNGNIDARLSLAGIYSKQGKNDQAQRVYIDALPLALAPRQRQGIIDQLGGKDGDDYLKSKKYSQALASYQKVLAVSPGEAEILLKVGLVYQRQQRYTEAEAQFRKLIEDYPGFLAARLRLGQLLEETGRIDEAQDTLELVAAQIREPRRAEIAREGERQLVGLYEKKADQLVAAVEHADLADEAVRKGYIEEGKKLLARKAYRPVSRVFSAMLARVPNDATVLYWSGIALVKTGNSRQGLALIEKSLAKTPGNVKLLQALAGAYEETGAYDQAIVRYQQVLQQQPDMIEARLSLAGVLQRTGRSELAYAQYQEVIHRSQDQLSRQKAMDGLGLVAGREALAGKDYNKAITAFTRAQQAAPDAAAPYMGLGDVYHAQGRNGEAEQAYLKTLEYDHSQLDARLNLVRVYLEQGRLVDGMRLNREVIAIAPASPQAKVARLSLDSLMTRQSQDYLARLGGNKALDDTLITAIGEHIAGLLDAGKDTAASQLALRLLDRLPDHPEALYWVGRVHDSQRQPQRAVDYLQRSLGAGMDDIAKLSKMAEIFLALKQDGDAIRIYDGIVRRGEPAEAVDRASLAAGMIRASQRLADKDVAGALEIYERLLMTHPEDGSLLLKTALAYELGGRHEEADRMFDRAQTATPDDVDLYLERARVYNERNDLAKATAQLKNALTHSAPDSPKHRLALSPLGVGDVERLIAQRKINEGLKIFDEIMATVGEDPVLYSQTANALARVGEEGGAEKLYNKSLKVAPTYQYARLQLGLLMARTERETSAIELLEQVVRESQSDEDLNRADDALTALYQQRADRLRRAGRGQEALQDYLQVLSKNPYDVEARSNLAVTYRAMGMAEDAIREFSLVEKYSPDNLSALTNLALLYRSQGRYREAIENFSRSIALQRDEDKAKAMALDLRFTLVDKLNGELETERAMQELQAISAYLPDNAQAHYMMAMLLIRAKNEEEALVQLQEAVRLDPNHVLARLRLGGLYTQRSDYELASDQYRAIIASGQANRVVENARLQLESVQNRLNPFSSSLAYSATLSEAKAGGPKSSGYGSTLNLNGRWAFRPSKKSSLAVTGGGSYTSNHASGTDQISPSYGVTGDLNLGRRSFDFSAMAQDVQGLLLEEESGSGHSAGLGGNWTFKNPFSRIAAFRPATATETPDEYIGISIMVRGQEPAAEPVVVERPLPPRYILENEALQQKLASLAAAPAETTNQYQVREGDTLWDISEALLNDPWLWPELWAVNPEIKNPDKIFPGDTVHLIYINGKPKLVLQRQGQPLLAPVPGSTQGMKYYRAGVEQLQHGKPDEALVSLSRIYEYVHDDILTNIYLGESYQKLREYEAAAASYQRAAEADPGNPEPRYRLVMLYREMASYQEAISQAEQVQGMAPETGYADAMNKLLPGLYRSLAQQALSQPQKLSDDARLMIFFQRLDHVAARGDETGVRELLAKAIAAYPQQAEPRFRLAELLVRAGADAEATQVFEACVQGAAQYPGCHLGLAGQYDKSGRRPEAVQHYQQVVRDGSDAQRELARRRVAIINEEERAALGQVVESAQALGRLAAGFPQDVEIGYRAAALYEQAGIDADAEQAYVRVLQLQPGYRDARLRLARVTLRLGKRPQAISLYKEVLATGGNADVYRELLTVLGFDQGLEQLRAGDHVAALATLDGVLAELPGDHLVLLNQALIRRYRKDYLAAEEIMTRILGEDPFNLTTRMQLAELYIETGRYDQAEVEIDRALALGDTRMVDEAQRLRVALGLKRDARITLINAQELPDHRAGIRIGYNDFISLKNNFFDTSSYTMGVSYSMPSIWGSNWMFGYNYSNTMNQHDYGKDYAAVQHQGLVSVSRPLFSDIFPGISGNLGVSFGIKQFTYPDSNAFYGLGITRHRQNADNSLRAGLSYRPHNSLSLSLAMNWAIARTNLPLGYIYRGDGRPVGRQSGTLGSYDSRSLSMSANFNF
ncbi:MAG: tetratricopeptide repeat protein [Gammaproteobacteria bacterium]|nr:tetratricopeptide repeat protein [Gammaproteobacteria bacterium]